jgi:hypothetical protein
MNLRALPHPDSTKNLSKLALGVWQEYSPYRHRGKWRYGFLNRSSPTRKFRREVNRRVRLMESFQELTRRGLTKEQAARKLRIGETTLWRYRKRIEPLTVNCGRKSIVEKLNPPAAILRAVRRLQVAGLSNADAWRAVAEDPRCPTELAKYLRSTGNISRSLLAATRLTRRKATVIEGPEFTVIE